MVGKVRKWTPDKVKLLRLMWAQNRTCAYIASQMFPDCTEQAVKLKAYYLGLPARVLDHGPWTAEVEAYLRARWSEGWSAGKIQTGMLDTFGAKVTRSAVIGKAHRIGCGRHPNSRPDGMSAVRKLARKQQTARAQLTDMRLKPQGRPPVAFKIDPLPIPVDEPDRASWVPLSDLGEASCRWVWGDPSREYGYCGREAVPGKAYCLGHLQKIYIQLDLRRPKREWNDQTREKIKELQRIIAE